jgi:predicted Rossmann fold nucleotide-binding protein DprA/Smf involved in DNA uptake
MTLPFILSEDTRVTLLLCARFRQNEQKVKSLTQSEFHKLDNLLKGQTLSPKNLLKMQPDVLCSICAGQEDISIRIISLLKQTKELDDTLLTWAKLGIWVIGEKDKGYPFRLLQRLRKSRYPLLFGAGPINYLDRGGVCIVGSRDSPKTALSFSATLGDRCAVEGLTVISSDMRGVDRAAVTSALDKSGRVIIVLSDRLEKAVKEKRYRQSLADGLLTMVTPFSPNSSFSVSKAVRANRYQYTLSDVAVIVESRRKGGIWSGADENRIEGWVPAFVRSGKTMSQGNLALQHLGLAPLTVEIIENVQNLSDFFISHAINHQDDTAENISVKTKGREPIDLFLLFLNEFHNIAASQAMSEDEIKEHFNIEKIQVTKWLERAKLEGRIRNIAIENDEPAWISRF